MVVLGVDGGSFQAKRSGEPTLTLHLSEHLQYRRTAFAFRKDCHKWQETSSANHVPTTADTLIFFEAGNASRPLFPNFSNCDASVSISFSASAETSIASRSKRPLTSPLEGASATLQLEGTLASQVKAWTDASISTNFFARKSTTLLSDKPRNNENFVPSLSTNMMHLLFSHRRTKSINATTAARVSASKMICFCVTRQGLSWLKRQPAQKSIAPPFGKRKRLQFRKARQRCPFHSKHR